MLALSRKVDQIVMIGDDIQVMVLEIRGDKVRLGFTAPADVKVHRREVWLQIRDNQIISKQSVSETKSKRLKCLNPNCGGEVVRKQSGLQCLRCFACYLDAQYGLSRS